jgi:hypothetical protein
MNVQKKGQKIRIEMFIIVPEVCPAGWDLTCDCCEHSDGEFQLVKPGSGKGLGFVSCHFSVAP